MSRGRDCEERDATARKWHTMTKMGEYDRVNNP